MHQYRLISLLVTSILVLTACVSPSTFVQPQPTVPHSTIQGTEIHEALFSWRQASIDSIDNKAVSTFFTAIPKLRILPGQHSLVAKVTFARGFGAGPYYGLVEINADLKGSQAYLVKSGIQGKQVQAWVEDSQGHRVSNIGSANYNVVPQSQTVIVPVYTH